MSPLSLPMMLFVCLMVGLAGFVDSAAGGGGLVSLPAYMAAGIPIHSVYACNKVSSAIGTTFSTARFFKSGALDLKIGLTAAACSFIGSGIASYLVLLIPDRTLKIILMIMMPLAAALVLSRRAFSDEDHSDRLTGGRKFLVAAAIGLMIGGYDGLFGPGTGTFAIVAFCTLMGYDMRRAAGNAKLLNLASNYASVITVVLAGKVIYSIALPAAVFGVIGHLIGSGFALKKGARFIRPMMICVLILLMLNLLSEMLR